MMRSENNDQMLTIKGETSGEDKAALLCDVIMLVVFLWNQICYGMDMLFLLIPLALIGVYLLVFGILPETYTFAETTLQITHRFRKKIEIPYENVFNYESSTRDAFVNILQNNTVKVYYTVGKKKKTALCRPCDVETFVSALKMNCPEFHEQQKSRLEVFFSDGTQNEKGDK